MDKMKIIWSEEDECFVASVTDSDSDIIGCGDTEDEARRHLENHLKDECLTPRKKTVKVLAKPHNIIR